MHNIKQQLLNFVVFQKIHPKNTKTTHCELHPLNWRNPINGVKTTVSFGVFSLLIFYSHSIVAGGLDVISYTIRLT